MFKQITSVYGVLFRLLCHTKYKPKIQTWCGDSGSCDKEVLRLALYAKVSNLVDWTSLNQKFKLELWKPENVNTVELVLVLVLVLS